MKNVRFLGASLTLAIFLLQPVASLARPVSDIVNTAVASVSRSTFLSWSFEVLELPKGGTNCTLPYARVPKGLLSTLCAAQTQGALDVFGKSAEFTLGQPITRGEALIVLTALTDRQEREDISEFRDVQSAAEKQAVMNAIALKWMLPIKSNLFGLTRQLTGTEALSLFQAVSGERPDKVPSITVRFTTPSSSGSSSPKQELLNAIWQLISRDYLYQDKVDSEDAAYRAIEGMVQSLNDPYTTFFRPAGADDFEAQIKGELSGIGAQIEEKEGLIIVVTPLPGSPAERAGIVPGDVLLEANGVKLSGIGVDRAVIHIRGERGTSVELKIRRGGTEFLIKVQRDTISIPEISVSWHGDIAVVQLAQFGETTEKRIRSVLGDIALKNPKGFVLDLRNNGGGLLSAADVVLSNFLPRGTVVAKVKNRTQTVEEKTMDEPVISPTTKIAVLVNNGSASASEIVAGALQDLKRATIVGTKSFGKGTVQEVVGFRSGEAIKLTIAEWFTPLGRTIDGTGIKPDVVVDSENRDEQLRRALDIVR